MRGSGGESAGEEGEGEDVQERGAGTFLHNVWGAGRADDA